MAAPVKSAEGRRDAILAVRIPSAIKERVEAAAAARGWTLTDTVIELIRRGFLYAPELPDPFLEVQGKRYPKYRNLRRRVEVEPGLVYDTCDPEPTDPRTKEAIADMVRAASRMMEKESNGNPDD